MSKEYDDHCGLCSKCRKIKADKLKHYAYRQPVEFCQLDVLTNMSGEDDVINPDEDGDSLWASKTIELMSGVVDVRALILPNVSKADAVRALRKMADYLDRGDNVGSMFEQNLIEDYDTSKVVDERPF